MHRRVLFAGGGTAGHVFPAVAVARQLVELGDWDPVFVGTSGRLEERLVPEAGFDFHVIDALPLPRRPSMGLVRLPGGLRRSRAQVRELITQTGAVGVATFGGYVSFPVSWGASAEGVPLLLHEQNAVPGLANQFAARWADRVALTFPSSADRFRRSRTTVTGNPVREEILALDRDAVRAEARASFSLDPERPTLLVFGGSQGARSLNRAVAGSARLWGDLDLQVIHAAGLDLHAEAIAMWQDAVDNDPTVGPTVRILDFIDDMSMAYAAADLVVCRAGATSIAELTALGLPSVLVPYPSATRDHQTANGRALERAGAAVVIDDDRLSSEALVAAVRPWLADPVELATASRRASAFGRRDAARLVAATIRDMVEGDDLPRGGVPLATVDEVDPLVVPDDDDDFDEAFAASSRVRTQQVEAEVASWDEEATDTAPSTPAVEPTDPSRRSQSTPPPSTDAPPADQDRS